MAAAAPQSCKGTLSLLVAGFLAAGCHASVSNASSAVDVRGEWTQFVTVAAAGSGDRKPRYGGRLDGLARIDAAKLGLWKGLSVLLHAEFVYGRSVNRIGSRLLLPVNTALAFPANDSEAADVSFSVVQQIGKARLEVGKLNLLERSSAIPIVGGGGREGFQHLGLVAPPALLASPKVQGAILSVPTGPVILSVGLWSPQDSTQAYTPVSFDRGVNVMVLGVLPVRPGGLQGYQNLTFYTTNSRYRRIDNPDVRPPPGAEGLDPPGRGGVHLRYGVQQYLWQDPLDPKRGWGVFGHAGVSTGTPDVLDWSMTAGLAGSVPIASRPLDKFGVGYFRVSLARSVVEGLAPIIALQDEQGAEIFYTVQVGKPLRLTATAQVVDSLLVNAPTAVFVGLRGRASF